MQSASNILPDDTISSNIEQPVKMLLLSGNGKLIGKNKPAKTDYYLMYLTLAISHRYTIPFRGFSFFGELAFLGDGRYGAYVFMSVYLFSEAHCTEFA